MTVDDDGRDGGDTVLLEQRGSVASGVDGDGGALGSRLDGMMATGGRGDLYGSLISGGGSRGVSGDIDRRDDGCHGDGSDDSGIDLGGVDCGCDGGSGDGGADGGGFSAALASSSAKVLKNDRARRRKAEARRARRGRP